MNAENVRLGILVGGGPAPGINSAISACTIEALNNGVQVYGILDGFSHLMAGDTGQVIPLTPADVAFIHSEGGLHPPHISRKSYAQSGPLAKCRQFIAKSRHHAPRVHRRRGHRAVSGRSGAGVRRCSTSGAYTQDHRQRPAAARRYSTFGFETARHLGTQLVQNLMRDSRTTNRWYVVIVMGRNAGHLALGIGSAAGAALTIIPEEFSKSVIGIDDVVRLIEGAMLKRKAAEGRDDGIAVVSEGIADRLSPDELNSLSGVDVGRDPHGHIRLGELPLSAMLRRAVQQSFADEGKNIGMVDVTIGYELRCASPTSFDIDYTRTLGYGASRLLLSEPTDEKFVNGGLIYLEDNNLSTLTFDELRDPATGRTRVRLVDTESERYKVAREYMVRVQPKDMEDDALVARMAEYGNRSTDEIRKRFGTSCRSAY